MLQPLATVFHRGRAALSTPRVGLALVTLWFCVQISPWWHATPDGTAYLSIARRLAAGEAPARLGNPQLGFPIGYPLIISPAFLLSDRPFLALSILHALLALVLVSGVFVWARRVVPDAAWLVTALVAANVHITILYRRTLSEAVFLPLLMWSANLLARSSRANVIAGSVCLLALSLVREAGILLALSFVVALLARGQQRARARALIGVLVALVLVAPWALRPERLLAVRYELAASFGAFDEPSRWLATLVEGMRVRVSEVGRLTVAGMFKAYARPRQWVDANLLLYVPMFAAVVIGWTRLVRRRADTLALAAPVYFAFHLFWPHDGGGRYLLPLLPVLVASLWFALERWAPRRQALMTAALAAHVAFSLGYWLIVDVPRARSCHAQWPAADALAASLAGAGTDSGSGAVMRDVPACVALMVELAVDRPLRRLDDAVPPGADVGWLITTDTARHVSGFAPTTPAGAYQLLKRVAVSQSPSAANSFAQQCVSSASPSAGILTSVIPAKAGIQSVQRYSRRCLDPRLRGDDRVRWEEALLGEAVANAASIADL